jgi:hypothetical protein
MIDGKEETDRSSCSIYFIYSDMTQGLNPVEHDEISLKWDYQKG